MIRPTRHGDPLSIAPVLIANTPQRLASKTPFARIDNHSRRFHWWARVVRRGFGWTTGRSATTPEDAWIWI